jgi:hypothetical protein
VFDHLIGVILRLLRGDDTLELKPTNSVKTARFVEKLISIRALTLLFIFLIISLYSVASCQAQSANSPTVGREERWREDLKYFASEFPARHKDFKKLYSQPNFDNEMVALQKEISTLSDSKIALRLMRLVASANVGHSMVYFPQMKLGFWPTALTLKWYSDGLAIVGAAPIYAEALGTHVLQIGSMTPERLLAEVAPYISHENDTWLREQSPAYFRNVEILKHVGAIGTDGRIKLTLAKPGGQTFTLVTEPAGPGMKQVSMFDALHIPATLYGKRPGSYYWYEYLADSRALYIQYNKCAIDPKLTFKDFTADLFSFADAHRVDRVIIDLRFNGGGNSTVISPLIAGLSGRKALKSRVLVLIGPATFSSAQLNALELRRSMNATLMGEPTGERLNTYGEVRIIKLPNSGLDVQYCTNYFRMSKDRDSSALEPDVRVPTTLRDVLEGRDPVLEAALKQPVR